MKLQAAREESSLESFHAMAIHEAILEKSLECCQLLLEAPAGVKLMMNPPDHVLKLWAVATVDSNDVELARGLLISLANMTGVRDDHPPLTMFAISLVVIAARKGRIMMLSLVEMVCPAALVGGSKNEEIPLYKAAQYGRAACVRILLPYFQEDNHWLAGHHSRRVGVAIHAFREAVGAYPCRDCQYFPRDQAGRSCELEGPSRLRGAT